jgi:predicted DNA-binding transcriptional regulator YafY
VSERTIYRDIEALSMAGIPVYAERGPGGGCRIAEGYRTNLTGLTEDEVRTLFLPGATRQLADLGISKVLEAAMFKLLASLPSAHQRDVERTRQRLYVDTIGWYHTNEEAPYLQVLREGVWQDRKIRMTYRKSNGEITERTVDPLALVAKAGLWYLVALSHGDLRVFRVSRVRNAALTDEPCQRPPDFDLEKFWIEWSEDFQTSWPAYFARLRISPAFVPILPHILGESVHALLEEADPPDCEGWITITYPFGSFEGARSYILGFGTMVEVLEPEELRQSVIQVASGIVEFYKLRES